MNKNYEVWLKQYLQQKGFRFKALRYNELKRMAKVLDMFGYTIRLKRNKDQLKILFEPQPGFFNALKQDFSQKRGIHIYM